MNKNLAIGVFDSGVGGLTVVKNLKEALPNENIIYFGDIARIPYGTKSRKLIIKYAKQTVKFLLEKNVKAIIIACNTISAIAKEEIQCFAKDIPIIDVVSAGVNSINNEKNIGVIATPATIKSNVYSKKLTLKNNKINVYSQECGLFVPIIEEGFIKSEATSIIAKEYLSYFDDKNIQALILGCTHYPLIENIIKKSIPYNIDLIDPALEAVEMLIKDLQKNNLLLDIEKMSETKFYVTDIPLKFKALGESFLNSKMDHLEIVNIDNY